MIKKHYPLITSLGVLCILLALAQISSLHKNGGHFAYATDDAYIHLSIAKNYALHNVWGIDKYNFTSCTSSPLWTFLISIVFSIFGVYSSVPLIMNIILSIILIVVIYSLLKKYVDNQVLITISLLSIIILTSIIPLIFSGQEHILQTLFVILFVTFSVRTILEDTRWTNHLLLFFTAAFMTGSRYEGLALLLIVIILFALTKKAQYIPSTLLGGILPVVIYGIWSVSNGWHFFPNSILLKGKTSLLFSEPITFARQVFQDIKLAPHLSSLITVSLFILSLQINTKNLLKASTILLTIFISASIFHILFARMGHFYRYEAYLVGLGIFSLTVAGKQYIPKFIFPKKGLSYKYIVIVTLIFWLSMPLIFRGLSSTAKTPQATNNIYEQQYQMGLFLKKFYQGTSVAANDIGAINFLSDIKCLDLWGLASLEVLQYKLHSKYNTQTIYNLCKTKNVKIAILYDKWFEKYGGLPSQWVKVGEWKIRNNVVCGDDKVSFYAVDPTETHNLIKNLQKFSKYLPRDVIQSGKYIQNL